MVCQLTSNCQCGPCKRRRYRNAARAAAQRTATMRRKARRMEDFADSRAYDNDTRQMLGLPPKGRVIA